MKPAAPALDEIVEQIWTHLEDAKQLLADARRALDAAPESGAAYSLADLVEATRKNVDAALNRYHATKAAAVAQVRGEPLFDHDGICTGCRVYSRCALLGEDLYGYCRGCAAEKAA